MSKPAAIIVDDQPSLAEALAQLLAMEGFHVVVTSTGAEALAAAAERSYDLAFVDVNLPDMSGLLAAGHLKERSPGLKVILMTGFAALVDDPTLAGAFADGVLPKPWKAGEMSAMLRKVAGG